MYLHSASLLFRDQQWPAASWTAPVPELNISFIFTIDVLEKPFLKVFSQKPSQPATTFDSALKGKGSLCT